MNDGAGRPAAQSPCISVCRIDPVSGLCVGCLRSLDEIACWSALDDAARREILRAVAERRAERLKALWSGTPS